MRSGISFLALFISSVACDENTALLSKNDDFCLLQAKINSADYDDMKVGRAVPKDFAIPSTVTSKHSLKKRGPVAVVTAGAAVITLGITLAKLIPNLGTEDHNMRCAIAQSIPEEMFDLTGRSVLMIKHGSYSVGGDYRKETYSSPCGDWDMFFVPCGSDFKFVLQGDGGWINWGMYGKFDRNDRVVKMRSGCTDGHVNIGKWRNYASEGVIPSSIFASVLSEWQVNNVRNEVHTPAPPKPLRKKNDWEFCSESDECHCDWCTARHSHDGKKRCTPKDWNGKVYENQWSSSNSKLEDWSFCRGHGQCKSLCCSKKWSDDGKLKCHPKSACAEEQGSSSSKKLDEWSFCRNNSQCKSNCCSKKWSDDGKLKCHPGSAC